MDRPELHEALVVGLKAKGAIRSPAVEAAFSAVKREHFLPGVPPELVYSEQAVVTKYLDGLPISSSSQPEIMALMLEQLGLEPGQRVLEIGAGTGYNAALMAHIVGETGRVVTVDIDDDTVDAARAHLAEAGFGNVTVHCGDGWLGYPLGAPYDRIILTVGSQEIAPAWVEQLGSGGRLVLPLAIRNTQKCIAFERVGDHLASVSVVEGGFMPLRGAFAFERAAAPVGPTPGMTIAAAGLERIDGDAIYLLLNGPSLDLATGVRAGRQDVSGGLRLWLDLRDARFCGLGAAGQTSNEPILSGYFGMPRSWVWTFGLLGENELCVLVSFHDREPAASASELFVRSYGAGGTLARQLIEQVVAWDAAGRPFASGLSVRAYPLEAGCVPTPGELAVEKRTVLLVLREA